MLISGLSLTALSATFFVLFLLLYAELGLSSMLEPPSYQPAPMRMNAVREIPSVEDNPVWKCGGAYTNVPNSPAYCEFVAGPTERIGPTARFITPAVPSRS